MFSQNLQTLSDRAGRRFVEGLLTSYSCPLDRDIEQFVRASAIDFSDRGIAKTHLAFLDDPDFRFAGVFTLTPKILSISDKRLTKTLRKKLRVLAGNELEDGSYKIPAILLAQFGKNFSYGIGNDTDGSELLALACGKARSIQFDLGGRVLFLDCKDEAKLIDFYVRNGFRLAHPDGAYDRRGLIQLFRFL